MYGSLFKQIWQSKCNFLLLILHWGAVFFSCCSILKKLIGSSQEFQTRSRSNFLSAERLYFPHRHDSFDLTETTKRGREGKGGWMWEIIPGSRLGPQRASGCRWCPRRYGRFSDLSSLSPLRHPVITKIERWPLILYNLFSKRRHQIIIQIKRRSWVQFPKTSNSASAASRFLTLFSAHRSE